ncbi:MAG TPA: hypothetical protein VLM38_16385 [Blastocatellia bacterium]|nr:hypothetical protein [Blastocatellia bacterium]
MPVVRVLKIIRDLAAWTTIPAFLSFVIADQIFNTKYGGGPHDGLLVRPALFEWLLVWRNWSLGISVATALISIPKWRSLIGLTLTLTYFYFAVTTY